MSQRRILVVDDASTVRLYYRTILEREGYAVSEAVNGLEGLEKALSASPPFDLYIVDVNMPKLDGYGFLRELRQQALPQVPALMISTEEGQGDRVEALRAGANYYLVKPVSPEELAAYCRLLLGNGGVR
jgi:two-component system chemotaxis response regulator CheY